MRSKYFIVPIGFLFLVVSFTTIRGQERVRRISDETIQQVRKEVRESPTTKENLQDRYHVLIAWVRQLIKEDLEINEVFPRKEAMELRDLIREGNFEEACKRVDTAFQELEKLIAGKQKISKKKTLYLSFVIHNEEDFNGEKPTGRADFDGNRDILKATTEKYREMGKLSQEYAIKVNLQSDWTFIKGVMKYDPTFFKDWEAMDHESDAHAHETHVSYSEVKQLLKEAGAHPTGVIGGTLEKNIQDNLMRWEATYPRFEILWGAATLMHRKPQEKTHYVWRPSKRGSWFKHDPKGKIIYIGGGGNPMRVDSAQKVYERADPNKVNVYTIGTATFVKRDELGHPIAPIEKFLKGIQDFQKTHNVQWKSLTEIAEIFKKREEEGTLDFSDVDVSNIPRSPIRISH